MTQLPDWPPTTVGQADSNPLTDSVIRAAVNDAIRQTSFRDDTPLPVTGTAPPVAQPGRPPMSQKATDASALMLAAGVASLPIGGMTSLVLYTLGTVDPVSLAIGAGAPVALILAVGALIRSAGRAKRDMHTETHHHYSGPVHQDQRNVKSKTIGLSAKTTNKP